MMDFSGWGSAFRAVRDLAEDYESEQGGPAALVTKLRRIGEQPQQSVETGPDYLRAEAPEPVASWGLPAPAATPLDALGAFQPDYTQASAAVPSAQSDSNVWSGPATAKWDWQRFDQPGPMVGDFQQAEGYQAPRSFLDVLGDLRLPGFGGVPQRTSVGDVGAGIAQAVADVQDMPLPRGGAGMGAFAPSNTTIGEAAAWPVTPVGGPVGDVLVPLQEASANAFGDTLGAIGSGFAPRPPLGGSGQTLQPTPPLEAPFRSAGELLGAGLVPTTPLDIGLTVAPLVKPTAQLAVDTAGRYRQGLGAMGAGAVPESAVARTFAPPAAIEPGRGISPTEGEGFANLAGGARKANEPIPISQARPGVGAQQQPVTLPSAEDAPAAKLSREELIARQQALLGEDVAVWSGPTGPQIEQAAKASGGFYREQGSLSKRASQMSEAMDFAEAKRLLNELGADTSQVKTLDEAMDLASKTLTERGRFHAGAPVRSDVAGNVIDLLAAPISLKSTLSPPLLRQGMTRFVTAPRAAVAEMGKALKTSLNEADALNLDATIRSDPLVRSTANLPADAFAGKTWEDAGGSLLTFGEHGTAETAPEELISLRRSWLGNRIRNLAPVKISDREAALELNLHRTNWFKSVAANMIKAGEENPAEYSRLREFIEHATQRGAWSQKIPAFFSTRALSGRIQTVLDIAANVPRGVAGGYLRPGATQETGKVLVGMVGAAGAMVGIPAALGLGEIEMKNGLPTLRVGPTHFDPWAGWNAIAKLAVGIAKDIDDATSSGIPTEDIPQEVWSKIANRGYDFLERGLSPSLGAAVSTAKKENWLGRPYNLADEAKSGRLFKDLYAPFIVDELVNAYRQGGLKQAALVAGPSFLSMGTNTYLPDAEIANKRIAEEMAKGIIPTTYLDANGQQQPVKTYADLRAADPLAADEFDKRNPDITQQRQAVQSETTKRLTELRTEFNGRQQERDSALLMTDPERWRLDSADDNARVQAAIEERARDYGTYEREPRSLLDIANLKYHNAIEANTVNGRVDWGMVDREVAKMSPQEQDLLFANRLAGETDARKQYIRDLARLEGFFQQRDEAWARLQQANPTFQQYASLDDFRIAKVNEVMQKNPNYPRPIVENLVDQSLGVYTQNASMAGAQYLVQHRDLVPLLAKYGFSVPSIVAPLAGQPATAGGVGR